METRVSVMPTESPVAPGLVHDQQHPGDGHGDRHRESRRDVFAEHERGEQHDDDRFEGPHQDRHAGGDRRQPDQAQRVGDARVEDAEGGEPAHGRRPGERLTANKGDDEQEDAAGDQLHGEKGEGRDVVDDLFGDDGAGAPACGGGDQGRDRAPRHGRAIR